MLKTHKAIAKIIVSYILPPILPVAVAVIISLQQIYYPDADIFLIFNTILLMLSLIEYLPLVINRKDKQPCRLVCNVALILEAFLCNVYLFGIPSPLENLAGFFNSICGVWVVVVALEVGFYLFPVIVSTYHDKTEICEDDEKIDAARSNENGSLKINAQKNEQSPLPSGPSPQIGKMKNRKRKSGNGSDEDPFSWIAFFIVVGILIGIMALPLFQPEGLPQWYDRVHDLAGVVFSADLIDRSDLLTLILYFVMMIAIVAVVLFVLAIIYYVVKGILRDRHGGIKAILKKYSAPVIILGIVFVAIRSLGDTGEGGIGLGFEVLGMLLESMLLAIIGIIGAFVLIEVVGLLLDECTAQISLLKVAMRLVFILAVQYTTNFITGILRVFAIKDVIESILLFFMPDLNVTIGAKIDQVFNSALEKEVCKLENDLSRSSPKEVEEENVKCVQPGTKITIPIQRRESDEK